MAEKDKNENWWVKNRWIAYLGCLLLIGVNYFILSANLSSTTPLTPTHDWTGENIVVKTFFYDSVDEVSQSYWEIIEDDGKRRLGWAGWNTTSKYCEIHTLRIQYQEHEEAMNTLGHEMLHCLSGEWHK